VQIRRTAPIGVGAVQKFDEAQEVPHDRNRKEAAMSGPTSIEAGESAQGHSRPNRVLGGQNLPRAEFFAARLACAEYDFDHYPSEWNRHLLADAWEIYARVLRKAMVVAVPNYTVKRYLAAKRAVGQAKRDYETCRALGDRAVNVVAALIEAERTWNIYQALAKELERRELESKRAEYVRASERAKGIIRVPYRRKPS
jgi:hypothetical protein